MSLEGASAGPIASQKLHQQLSAAENQSPYGPGVSDHPASSLVSSLLNDERLAEEERLGANVGGLNEDADIKHPPRRFNPEFAESQSPRILASTRVLNDLDPRTPYLGQLRAKALRSQIEGCQAQLDCCESEEEDEELEPITPIDPSILTAEERGVRERKQQRQALLRAQGALQPRSSSIQPTTHAGTMPTIQRGVARRLHGMATKAVEEDFKEQEESEVGTRVMEYPEEGLEGFVPWY